MVSMNKKTSLKLQGARMLTTCYDPFKEEHLWGWVFFGGAWGVGGVLGCLGFVFCFVFIFVKVFFLFKSFLSLSGVLSPQKI